jgi:hypothetical protein
LNDELHSLFDADQAERHTPLTAGTPEYQQLRERDGQRRRRAAALIAEGALHVAEDYFHAAWVLHHGETPDEIWQAHTLASAAAERGLPGARWLAAAALDRWLMYQGRPQKYGTQIVPDGTRWRIWDTDPTTTDADRAAWDVPTMADQLERAGAMTSPQPPMEEAPWWLKEALKGWT